jgi:hypothetical protein
MNRFFSFQRMITASFVRGLYFLGFVVLTTGSIALIIWASLALDRARIDRALGWRYVAIGASALIIGNLVWRVFCEIWIVLFNIHDRLVSIDEGWSTNDAEHIPVVHTTEEEPLVIRSKESTTFQRVPRSVGVLGLS